MELILKKGAKGSSGHSHETALEHPLAVNKFKKHASIAERKSGMQNYNLQTEENDIGDVLFLRFIPQK